MDTTAGSFQLSPQQEQIWAREPGGPQARTQGTLALHGRLDAAAVEAALEQTMARHEILRTTFARQPGLRFPLQVVADAAAPALTVLSTDPAGAEAQAARHGALTEPFDHESGPLVRALLVGQGDAHALTLTVSALCADPASLALALGELASALTGAGELIEDPLQYADFAAWQSELLASQEGEAISARERLDELAAPAYPELPFAGAERRGTETVAVELEPGLAAAIGAASERYGVSPAAFVQAAWHALLARVTATEQPAVAVLAGERRHGDLEGAIGAFARPIPIAPGAPASFAELAHAVARAGEEALVLQDYAPVGAHADAPCGFVAVAGARARGAERQAELTELTLTAPFALWLTCLTDGDALRLTVGFDAGVHAAADAQRLAGALARLLGAAAVDPGAQLATLPVLSDAERAELLEQFAGPAAEIPTLDIGALIAQRAAAAPDAPAVIDATGTITHAALQARAAQVAHWLIAAGVAPGDRVALCAKRGHELVGALLGILQAGAAYVPLHNEHPKARLADQLATAQVTALVTQQELLGQLPEFGGPLLCLDRDGAALDALPATTPQLRIGPDSLAYVIYTSGSTGAPKGVGVTHANLANYIAFLTGRLGAEREPLRFAMVTSIATDLGNTCLFGALGSGGTLVLPSAEAAGDPGPLAELFQSAGVDVLKITPSHLGALLAAGDARILPRRWLILGGERAPWDLIDSVRQLASREILNHYGPTETTIGSCTYLVGEGPGAFAPASVPIGAPIANTACRVLDAHGELVPVGVPGRLHISGAGVASGYVGAAELTAERFAADPFAPGQRMYDTGDLARWLPDGNLEFLGRADDQVKIRGYRVEPGEIEAVLRAHPAVTEAIVVAHAAGAEVRLAAYCGAAGQPGVDELREHLAAALPDYMIPAAVAVLERLPRTPSGKIDRQALPDPDTLAVEEGEYTAPRSPMEEAVAAIWAAVLGLPRVGVQDDFFSLGGHSLLATQVVAQVRSDFAVDLPLHSLFTYPTVSELTAEIVGMMGAADDDETARLMAELDGMSDEEAERLLRGDRSSQI